MTQAAKAQEPSMEEILASIRRIIADDDPTKPPGKPVDAAPARVTAPAPRPAAVVPPVPPSIAAPPAPAPESTNIKSMLVESAAQRIPEPDPETSDVFELTEEMAAAAPQAQGFRTIDGEPDVVFDDATVGMASPSEAPVDPRRLLQDGGERPLVSQTTRAAVDSAFNTLAHTVLVQNARTLEDLVREMLRPMLKSWLDDNLPGLVERLVRAEIERVSRGRS